VAALLLGLLSPAFGRADAQAQVASTAGRPSHQQSAAHHDDASASQPAPPPLPEGMTLDEVLERADQPKPKGFPDPVPDDEPRAFLLVEQLEYRLRDGGLHELGWESKAWVGFDYDKLWWKSEGESVFAGPNEGEAENDVLYSRLLTPFWYAQIGVQYASAWERHDYSDRWSGVLAVQGLAPGMFEIDTSLYVSEDADVTADVEAEYDLRLTQRLVLQPRIELDFAAQDVRERDLGAGLTDANLDLRLRYEILRELAPYVGVRYRVLPGETGNIAERNGEDDDAVLLLVGVRWAFP
jgi:copper resistance protein B